MGINFQRNPPVQPPIRIQGQEVGNMPYTKLVGLFIQEDLKWDTHINKTLNKTRTKLHFIMQLKRSGVPPDHIVSFFKSVAVPQLEYACPVWATSITKEQSNEIEKSKKELKIAHPNRD